MFAIAAILVALAAPAGAALVNAKGIANNAVLSRHIKNGQVRSIDIGPRQVTNRNLAVRAVKGNNLAPGSVGTVQVADGSITGGDLADGSITASDLAPGTIPTFSIGAGTVTGTMLADGTVTAADLAAGSVTSAAIAAGAVTSAKIATGAVGEAEIGAGAVDSIELASGAVLAQHVGANAVSGAALGEVVGAGLTATSVTVPNDTLETMPGEEADGMLVPFAAVLWNSGSSWSIATPTDVVLASDGLYQVDAWVSWDANAAGYREAQVVHEGGIVAQDRRLAGSSMGNRINQTLGTTIVATAGDVVQLRVSHQAGSNLDADRVRFTVRRVGTQPPP